MLTPSLDVQENFTKPWRSDAGLKPVRKFIEVDSDAEIIIK